MILGAMVTYRRPRQLASFLEAMSRQTRKVDLMVVVDNDPAGSGWPPIKEHLAATTGPADRAAMQIDYLPQRENSGAAGGWAVGQRHLVEHADDDDWIVMLDDDDPPRSDATMETRETFAKQMIELDHKTAAVGEVGAFLDRPRGRLRRLADSELSGPVPVDYVGSNHFPFYRVGVMRRLGPFFPGLFLGYTELEYSLRVSDAGYHIYVDGDAALLRRERNERLELPSRSRSKVDSTMPPWRVYYTTRNLVWMLRLTGNPAGALRVSVRRGLGRGVSHLAVSPRTARKHLKAGLLGIRHGWTNVMGPVLDPEDGRLLVRRDRITICDTLAVNPIPPDS